MGIELKIQFEIQSKERLENSLKIILEPINQEVTVHLEEDGFYFCDNCVNPPHISSHVFRQLVDIALIQSARVVIYEL